MNGTQRPATDAESPRPVLALALVFSLLAPGIFVGSAMAVVSHLHHFTELTPAAARAAR